MRGGAFRGIYQKETETALNVGGLAKTLRRMSPGLTEEAAKTLADGILAKNGISVSSGAIGSLVYQLVMSEALETNPGQHGISVVGDNYQQFLASKTSMVKRMFCFPATPSSALWMIR